ncbi:MAG: DNA-binding response OmpR family regulator [Sulfitobacter sp.]|jgi:DNA-binding response OmpR family regulator
MKILVVDDDTLILEILELFLSSVDYTDVTLVQSGAEALQAIESASTPFDCILLDINMPRQTGTEVIPLIRQNRGYEFVPIIMLTAQHDKKNIAEAFIAGAWDYVTKPFEFFELETRLHAVELRAGEMARRAKEFDDGVSSGDVTMKRFFALHRPVAPEQITQSGLVGEGAFENCFTRISNKSYHNVSLTALRLDNLDNLSGVLQEPRTHQYLVKLASAVAEQMAPWQGIVTYLGKGAFMIMSFEPLKRPLTTQRKAIQSAIADVDGLMLKHEMVKTEFSSWQIHGTEVPEGVEPSYLLYAVKNHLALSAPLQ